MWRVEMLVAGLREGGVEAEGVDLSFLLLLLLVEEEAALRAAFLLAMVVGAFWSVGLDGVFGGGMLWIRS